MLRLAWCSPFPPERSGIADYSVELIEAVSACAEVVLFCNDPAAFDAPSLNHLDRHPIADLGARRFEFDLPIYQIGNHPCHGKIIEQAYRHPGILVLHEFSLDALIGDHQAGIVDQAAVFREIVYETPPSEMQNIGPDDTLAIYHPPHRLIESGLGIMVHSDFVAKRIGEMLPQVAHNLFVTRHHGQTANAERAWPESDDMIFSCVGQMTPHKQIDKVLDALRLLTADGVSARLRLIGEPAPGLPLQRWIDERGLTEQVETIGFVDALDTFKAEIAESHVVINLRQPTVGETSGAVLRSMGVGRPVIVYDHGWYAELPDCCIKIRPNSLPELTAAMGACAADLDRVKRLGDECAAEIEANHRPELVAKAMVSWLEKTVQNLVDSEIK